MTLDFENLDDFFLNTDFSRDVLVGPVGSEVTIRAIFDNAYFSVEDSSSHVSTVKPFITCKTSDTTAMARGTRVVIGGVAYRVADKRPDGTGISEVDLHKL